MRDDENRETRRRSARLPATVLVIMLSLVGWATYWLSQPLPEPGVDRAVTEAPAPGHTAEVKKPAATAPRPTVAPVEATDKPPEAAAPASASEDHKPPVAPPKQDVKDAKPPAHAAATAPAAKPPIPPPVAPPPVAPPASAPPPPAPVPAPPTAKPASPARTVAIAPPLGQIIPKLPPAPPSAPLRQAPDPALVEQSKAGPLPIVGRDGREAWRVYARPFDQVDQHPRISVVLYGLGTSQAATRSAIQSLPGAVTLAFSPYASKLGDWLAEARASGHETLMMVPMEPRNYPDYDPGPQALLTSLSGRENTQRLEWILGRGVGYVGVVDFMGSRFTNSTGHMRALFRDLKKRGLLFLESRVSSRSVTGEIAAGLDVPFASSALYIDGQASRPAIDSQLAEAERLARELGSVAVMGFPYPVTLERVAKWAASVEKRGIVLAPVSAIARRRGGS